MSDADTIPETLAKPAKSDTRDFMEFLLKLGIFVFILRSVFFAPFSIPSESMVPRLLTGDYLIVAKWPYGFSRHSLPFSMPLLPAEGRVMETMPARGDVVVFKKPPEDNVDFIKRVIGLPGDMVQMRAGQLFINGAAVPKVKQPDFILPETANTRCYSPQFTEAGSNGLNQCRYPRYRETLPGGKTYDVIDIGQYPADDTQIYTVPDGHVFMLGDNRDNSGDSRLEAGGFNFVPVANIVGRAQFTAFSTDGSAGWVLPWTWFSAARWNRIGEGF
jgi:signal peptidase I